MMEYWYENRRKHIPQKIRWKVYCRDNFTCVYCGRKPPEVVLEIDHIIPVSFGGDNNIDNLATSCKRCNTKKKNRLNKANTLLMINNMGIYPLIILYAIVRLKEKNKRGSYSSILEESELIATEFGFNLDPLGIRAGYRYIKKMISEELIELDDLQFLKRCILKRMEFDERFRKMLYEIEHYILSIDGVKKIVKKYFSNYYEFVWDFMIKYGYITIFDERYSILNPYEIGNNSMEG